MLTRPSNSQQSQLELLASPSNRPIQFKTRETLGLPRRHNTVDSPDNLLQCGRFKPTSLQIRRPRSIGEYQPILMTETKALSVDVGRVPDVTCTSHFCRLDLC